jgi:hypothetical protein
MSYRANALPADLLRDLRATGRAAAGGQVEHAVATGGEPLRCCLRDAVPGESLLLFGYEPPLPPSPYREIGPVFAHEQACPGRPAQDGYPPAWRGRSQVLRAYDERGWIHEATTVHDGTVPEAAIAAVLARPGVVQIHSRNVAYGCFMFTITRA